MGTEGASAASLELPGVRRACVRCWRWWRQVWTRDREPRAGWCLSLGVGERVVGLRQGIDGPQVVQSSSWTDSPK